ncbi:MAG: Asp-tRNA(Asn)/Glu-tRNA(Gln) amidotransferase subunit GatA [Bacteroidetes bacterium]|nr:Asp-tRNA(Asn)/Glu-tRNA(Gln) amidotransferase subunit GatA [Bacteroidota bacterium]MBS1931388.1 Asp-tRNA(Asn)/Glu-tRNA(Gln) amidotransferase subunit GatA [Bacteroidota bacterium]
MFEFSSIEQYHAQLQQENTNCELVVQQYLRKIKEKNHLNSFIEVFEKESLEKARELDRKRKTGHPLKKLHGVVIALKDVICYHEHQVSAASNILKGFSSVYSATVVERLIAEDTIIIGRTNCDEFAMGSTNENSAYGKVLNAFDETRTPGGSSGGSAVAVQAGLCMISLGSDTGGSVRQPADFCGVVGMKPTYGRISRYGLIAYASSFDQIGIFGKTIADVSKILEVISGKDEFDSTVSQKKIEEYSLLINEKRKFSFAFFTEALEHPSLDIEIASSIKKLIEELRTEGHEVNPVSFELLDYIVPAYYILTTAEASSNLSRYDGVKFGYRTSENDLELEELYKRTRTEGFGKEVKRRIMLGTFVLSAGYFDAYYTRAQKVRKKLVDRTNEIFQDFDFIILPTAPTTAFRLGEKMNDPIAMYLADIYTVLANLTGIPAISIPLFYHSNGMPFGLQLMSKQFNESSLLQISNQLMKRGIRT